MTRHYTILGSFHSLLAAATLTACVSTEEATATKIQSTNGDILSWDFGARSVEPPGRSLWPSEEGMPERLRRGMTTAKDNGLLTATVDGPDPAFIWQFQTPIEAAGLYVDAEFEEDAYLQVFWMTSRCKVYQEVCSTTEKAPKGRRTLQLILPRGDPIRELRLDLAEKNGLRIVFNRILLSREQSFDSAWTAFAPARVEVTDDGLIVRSAQRDPWIYTRVPPMSASSVDTVMFDVEAPRGSRAQFFWQGSECEHFDERCSVVLPILDGGATSLALSLDGIDAWNGQIEQLRFDPADGPGEYRIRRIALTTSAK